MNVAAASGFTDLSSFKKYRKTHNTKGLLATKSNQGKMSSAPADAMKILDPAKKKLTAVEAQRIMAVIDEGIKKVEIVTVLKFASQNLERFSVSFGDEVANAIETHFQNLNRFIIAHTEVREIKGNNSLSFGAAKAIRHGSSEASRSEHGDDTGENAFDGLEGLQKHVNFLGAQARDTCRTILRSFTNNPTALSSLKTESMYSNRTKETEDLIGIMVELKAILLSKLLTTPSEEKAKEQHLSHVTQSERKASEIIKRLEAELNVALEDRDVEVSKRNDVIRRLKNDLHSIEKYSEEMNRRTLSEAAKQEGADSKNSDGRRAKFQHDISNVRQTLAATTLGHRENELNLRKKKFKLETEVENWIQKYDQDMSERQNEIEEIEQVYTKEKAQLASLEEKFRTLKEEYDTIMEERRIARQAAEAAERQMAAMVRAALRIQTFFRAFKARRLFQKRKEKLRKKGRKSRKGKKPGNLRKAGKKRR